MGMVLAFEVTILFALFNFQYTAQSKQPPEKRDAGRYKSNWQDMDVQIDIYESKELESENRANVEEMKEEGKILNYRRCNYCQGT